MWGSESSCNFWELWDGLPHIVSSVHWRQLEWDYESKCTHTHMLLYCHGTVLSTATISSVAHHHYYCPLFSIIFQNLYILSPMYLLFITFISPFFVSNTWTDECLCSICIFDHLFQRTEHTFFLYFGQLSTSRFFVMSYKINWRPWRANQLGCHTEIKVRNF